MTSSLRGLTLIFVLRLQYAGGWSISGRQSGGRSCAADAERGCDQYFTFVHVKPVETQTG